MGHITTIVPVSVIRSLGLAMLNLCTKIEVFGLVTKTGEHL